MVAAPQTTARISSITRTIAAVADIVADRVVEQHRVLRDDADGSAQAVCVTREMSGRRCGWRRRWDRKPVDGAGGRLHEAPDGPTTASVVPGATAS